eukprot:COSAG03_NODE_9749_length_696_cov_1.038526_1_plen_130_part_01
MYLNVLRATSWEEHHRKDSEQRVSANSQPRLIAQISRHVHGKVLLPRSIAPMFSAGDGSSAAILSCQHAAQATIALSVNIATNLCGNCATDRPDKLSSVLPQYDVVTLRPVTAGANDGPHALITDQDTPY